MTAQTGAVQAGGAGNYVQIITARLNNIRPPHSIRITESANIVNFLTLKRNSLIKRKKGLRFLSSIAHELPVTFAGQDTFDLFGYFSGQGKVFKKKPLIARFKNTSINGSPATIDGVTFQAPDKTVLGTFDPYEGILTFNQPVTQFSSQVTIELLDRILAIGYITVGRSQVVLMTDGRSLFRYDGPSSPFSQLSTNYSLSVGKLNYTPPENLTNIWWIKEVFLEETPTGTKGKVLLSSGKLDPQIPVFFYETSNTTGLINPFEPKLTEKTVGNTKTTTFLTGMKRVDFLKGHLFASRVIEKEVVGSAAPTFSERDKRVVWSRIGRDPTNPDNWNQNVSTASWRELDNPITDTAILNNQLIISTNRGFWKLTPSFADGESINSGRFLDNFPAFAGMVNLSSRGILYTMNTRGIFKYTGEMGIENLSEINGVDISPIISSVTNPNFQNFFSLSDEREGIYYFYNQSADEKFSGASVVYSLENNSFSFFNEAITCGQNVILEAGVTFKSFTTIGRLSFTRPEAQKETALEMVLGDNQGNIYKRSATPGRGNRLFVRKGEKIEELPDQSYFIKGEGFKNPEINNVFKWRPRNPDVLTGKGGVVLSIEKVLTNNEYLGRWIILEKMEFKSGQMNTFQFGKRITLQEIRLFVENLSRAGIQGQFTIQVLNTQRILHKRTIDLTKRRESFLFGKWIKSITKTSGMSVGFNITLSDDDFYSGNSAFELDISSLNVFVKR